MGQSYVLTGKSLFMSKGPILRCFISCSNIERLYSLNNNCITNHHSFKLITEVSLHGKVVDCNHIMNQEER